MITGEMKSKVDRLWTTFWNNGISNPLSVIEQISYLLFIKRLDDLELAKEKKAQRLDKPISNPTFSAHQQRCRWSYFKNLTNSEEMLRIVRDEAFPFIKTLGANAAESAYVRHMKDAVFLIANPALLSNVVGQIDQIPMEDRDTKGDLYEYMLSKLTTAGTNGQFRTPRHIIKMIEADGLSLDDKRQPVEENDIPDLLQRWKARNPQQDTDRTGKAFFVSKNEIKANGYDLSINRYKEIEYEEVKNWSLFTVLTASDFLIRYGVDFD